MNGGFNSGFNNWKRTGDTNRSIYTNGAYEGTRYVAINTRSDGGSIYQDIPVSIKKGDTFCGRARLKTDANATGGGGSFAIWLRGNTTTESSKRKFNNLPSKWTNQRVCATAKSSHSQVRVQFYVKKYGPTMGIDAVDVHRSLAKNGGFNSGFEYWKVMGDTNRKTYTSGAYEGARYVATNTQSVGGGIYQDIPVDIKKGDKFCGKATFSTDTTGGGGSGTFKLFLSGVTSAESGQKAFSNLPSKGKWTERLACATADRAHSRVRIQVYVNKSSPTIGVDAVDVYKVG